MLGCQEKPPEKVMFEHQSEDRFREQHRHLGDISVSNQKEPQGQKQQVRGVLGMLRVQHCGRKGGRR